MLLDEKSYMTLEKVIYLFRWVLIFITLFTLEEGMYLNMSMFEKLVKGLTAAGIWNFAIYFFVLGCMEHHKMKYVSGIIELIGDMLVIGIAAKVLGIYGGGYIYILMIVAVVIVFIKYLNSLTTILLVGVIIVNAIYIDTIIFKHDYYLATQNLAMAICSILITSIAMYLLIEEYKRLKMLVSMQADNVQDLEKNIRQLADLTQMSTEIHQSTTSDDIMGNLLNNIYRAIHEEGITVLLYSENGIESDTRIYTYKQMQQGLLERRSTLDYKVLYIEETIETIRVDRQYRNCIMLHEPLIIRNIELPHPLKNILTEGLSKYVYLFTIIRDNKECGIVICNVEKRLKDETCNSIDELVKHASMAFARNKSMEQEKCKSMYDALTGIKSRLHIDETLPKLIAKAKKNAGLIAIMFLDIDNFKRFNDDFGHDTGDIVLKTVAEIINSKVPTDGLVGRYGGEEFLAAVYDVDEKEAYEIGENIRKGIESFDLSSVAPVNRNITISIGVALYPEHSVEQRELIKLADHAMYEAKKTKNTVCIYSANKKVSMEEKNNEE